MIRAVVVCPGRGTYNAPELGWLARHFPDPALLARFDGIRTAAGQTPLAALDGAARFARDTHGRGDNAAGLIFAASLGDHHALDPARIEVVAITGNSMGWYTALAAGGAVRPEDGFRIANTMGTLMHAQGVGGQTVYPWLGPDWCPDPSRRAALLALVAEIGGQAGQTLALSIDLGGMLVLAGTEAGLAAFEAAVERIDDRFPMRLPHHAAFHTGLQAPVAEAGRAALSPALIGQPQRPLIDGRGAIWWPGATDPAALYAYTLGHQVTEPYDFTRAITVAAREFAPDLFVVTGPGATLGGAVAQSLVLAGWRGLADKAAFKARQTTSAPVMVSMGIEAERARVT